MKKILIVDDEPMMIKIAARALKEKYEVLQASSGAEALDIFDLNEPDLVLSDLKMPEMSGEELLRKIKAKSKTTPFVLMTADDDYDLVYSGADDCVKKPVKADILISRVERLLGENLETQTGQASDNSQTQNTGDLYKAEKDKLPEWLKKASFINVTEGLNNSETADGYLSSIDIFLAHAEKNIEELESFIEAKDIEDYTIKVHAIKSTSKIIGAMVLSSLAAALEKAGKNKDTEFIDNEHTLFIDLYKKHINLLMQKAKDTVKKDISQDELEDSLMALKEYAGSEDYSLMSGAVEYLQKRNLPPEYEKMISDIGKSLLLLDWDRIRGIIEVY